MRVWAQGAVGLWGGQDGVGRSTLGVPGGGGSAFGWLLGLDSRSLTVFSNRVCDSMMG